MQFTTPMMKQWKNLKDKAKDALLLFRLGDFYEAFYEDALIISKALDLTLTQRQNIAMCGVPHHASEIYIDRLIAKGFKLAIAEQMEDPQKTKGIVKRDIVKILSPGVIINSNLLKEKSNNFFISLSQVSAIYGLAIIDLSTSDFYAMEVDDEKELLNELQKLKPSEILVSKDFKDKKKHLFETLNLNFKFLINEKDKWYFNYEFAHEKLINHFNIVNLDSFGLKTMLAAINAAGALLTYLTDDLSMNLSHIKNIKTENLSSFMAIDYFTMKNLEIIDSNNSLDQENTLLNLLDKTSTAMGGRLLKKWLKLPLLNIEKIQKRQNAIEEILNNFESFLDIQTNLENIKDIQRLLIKLINKNASPKDLATLRFSIKFIEPLKRKLQNVKSSYLLKNKENLKDITSLLSLLEKALVDQPPIRLSDGNIFKKGYNTQLDEIKQLSENSFLWLTNYQNELKEKTNIKTLKVKYNKIFGYFIEVSHLQVDKVPNDFIRRQTLVNTERFVTEKLKDFETKVLSAKDKLKALENKLFNELIQKTLKFYNDLETTSRAIARIDVLFSLAKAAKIYNFSKPEINTSNIIDIKKGRHPIIEASSAIGEFIPNDTYLDNVNNQLLLLTGPNMAGKSTYIRQVALIVIMAQIGSFVPAMQAKIGIVDKVFSRIGATDDLSKGQSTFMVEMTETANILNNATNKSLIILDEIGRGTSTYDGISIAWAVAEYLLTQVDKKAKTLFATHYFELTNLTNELKGVVNYNVAIKDDKDGIVFLRKIVKGATEKSYGIHVAQLANMPEIVIKKAKERLLNLENCSNNKKSFKTKKTDQMSLFNLDNHLNQKIINEIKKIDVNNLTPIEALQKIYYFKKNIEK